RPRLGPAVGDAGLDRLPGNLAAVAVEQREFSTGLIEAALEISPLRHGRPHRRLIGVFMMARWGFGNPAQAGVTARGFPIARTHAHGRHPLTILKTSLPRRFIWVLVVSGIPQWHGGLRAANRARCHTIDHHTPVARPAQPIGRGVVVLVQRTTRRRPTWRINPTNPRIRPRWRCRPSRMRSTCTSRAAAWGPPARPGPATTIWS